MQTLAGVAHALDELALDEAVHVLVRTVHERRIRSALLEQRGQRGFDLTRFVRVEHAGFRERAPVREAARDIVFEEAAIEAERGAEFERGGVWSDVEASGP